MKKLINLFDGNQKFQFLILVIFMIIASFLELLGLGIVLVILNMFLGLNDNYLKIFNDFSSYFFNIEMNFEFILIFILVVFSIKLLLLVYSSWIEANFLAVFREKISNKLYHNFLNRDILKILKKNSAEYLRNFTEEITLSVTFLSSCIRIILELNFTADFFDFFDVF